MTSIDLGRIRNPIIRRGDARLAYRDPLLHYHDGVFRLYHTLVRNEADGRRSFHIGVLTSRDLVQWSDAEPVTSSDDRRNFCGPGSLVRHGDWWVLCGTSYIQPEAWQARCWTWSSQDLTSWSEPRVMRLMGPEVPNEEAGRAIDPYLFRDKDDPGRWWCFYKHGGLHISRPPGLTFGGRPVPPNDILLRSMRMAHSTDLETWNHFGTADAEENYCVLVDQQEDEYVLIYAPANGIGVKRSADLRSWYREGTYTLGQPHWPWSQGRITAGHVLDMRAHPQVGTFLLVFHGATPRGRATMAAHGEASLGIAWSDDLARWYWPE